MIPAPSIFSERGRPARESPKQSFRSLSPVAEPTNN